MKMSLQIRLALRDRDGCSFGEYLDIATLEEFVILQASNDSMPTIKVDAYDLLRAVKFLRLEEIARDCKQK